MTERPRQFRPSSRRGGRSHFAAGTRLEPLESRVLLSEVTGRFLFYNNSVYDGYSPLPDDADDLAIASDKLALLPGEPASFANYTSYSRGINGVMFDLSGPDAASALAITADDVEFLVGNSPDPQSWGVAPEPSAVSVREAGGERGPVRVSVTWADGAIRNRWLQVTVKANGTTGLASPDVFFFGNLPGETGNESSPARVTAADASQTRVELFNESAIEGPCDFDRSGMVDAADLLLARRRLYHRLYAGGEFAGAGMGLAATYFDDPEFAGVSAQRVDRTVDFDWQGGAPAPGIEPNTYSVRWEGQVRPQFSEAYTFQTTSNDGVRLWVDGRLIVDNWTNHAATVDAASIPLEAGRKYDLRLEYYQHLGNAVMKLQWSSPSLPREVVQTARLYPAAPRPVPAQPGADEVPPTPPALPGDWRMIFNDEFQGDGLDPVWHTAQYWNKDHTIVGKGELQAYDASGASVSGGLLHLTARQETKYDGVPYVSGLVQTGGATSLPDKPTFNFLYGYLEVRAKLPAGQGMWPAVWMMPASHNDANGELDVIEMLGSDPIVSNFNVHRGDGREGHEWIGANLSRTFHTFAVDWQSDHVTWYVDGVERARVTDPALICPEAMYPILNVAVGGTWGGPPDETTVLPASMDVDYVRVWQTQ